MTGYHDMGTSAAAAITTTICPSALHTGMGDTHTQRSMAEPLLSINCFLRLNPTSIRSHDALERTLRLDTIK